VAPWTDDMLMPLSSILALDRRQRFRQPSPMADPAAKLDEALEDPPGEDLSPAEWNAAWAEEIARRIGEVERGEVELLDGDEVMAEIRKKYGWD
jgi:hypothetical protein